MATEILMPALSPTMEEGTLAKWLVKEGDTVKSGDILAEIETDKATMEFEAVDEGTVGRLLVSEGTQGVKVNTPIAVLVAEGESADAAPQGDSGGTVPHAAEPLAQPGKGEASKDETGEAPERAPAAAKSAVEAVNTPEPDDSPDWPECTAVKQMTVREALREAMAEEMDREETVFLMGEEVGEYQGAYKISQGLLDKFGPRRVVDTPISEMGFAGIGVGAAFGGLRPIVEFMTFNFAMQAMDQIINSAAKTLYMSGGQMGCPIVFRGPNGAAARVGAQHSQDFAAWYAAIPGLKVVMPYTAADAKGLLKTAIRDPNPVIFLENEILYGRSFDVPQMDDFTVPFGKARVARKGKDVTLISFGIGMAHSLEAAEKLAADGIDAEVLDLRTLRPIDYPAILKSVQKTNRVVTVEEGFPVGAIGNHLSAWIMENAFDWLDAPVINCTGKDVPMPYAANLERLALITADEVVEAVRKVTYR
ncbi:pyruvate dehydrogenase complex E1 component subunit beta [Paracoccus sp. MC1862]|uniref:pyruvate dehydrogenase complex E1 component subunit beta n=1 Tax=Paracoccus sp. MC1862 TaxID=2760307 RepID=UPI0015FFD8D0|nr:pyruvate dehydrogenase complex E1 component subunit beta [Paracoccus sp. MC1862]MBB1497231.1 pyruvate dehydrogenase complex E1 component subunit beta [Paracoccus sp. MC1862]QQO44796.1 pyruvate dehydrogenase complex E1 component subunit beta [Paracoccus sp. MC1862]